MAPLCSYSWLLLWHKDRRAALHSENNRQFSRHHHSTATLCCIIKMFLKGSFKVFSHFLPTHFYNLHPSFSSKCWRLFKTSFSLCFKLHLGWKDTEWINACPTVYLLALPHSRNARNTIASNRESIWLFSVGAKERERAHYGLSHSPLPLLAAINKLPLSGPIIFVIFVASSILIHCGWYCI